MALKVTNSNSHSEFTGARERDSVSASTLRWPGICLTTSWIWSSEQRRRISNSLHRCFQPGLGSLSRGKLGLRVVVSSTTEGTHQPVGDESSSFDIVSMEQKKSCSWNIKTHYLRFKHFFVTITDEPSPC
jgi:hypothetical protein